MKLLIVYHSGLADDAKSIFKEYARRGIDLMVIVPRKNKSLVYSPAHDQKTFNYIPLAFKSGFNIFSLFFAIKKNQPDIIHVIDEYPIFLLFQTIICRNLLSVLSRKKIPIFSLSFQNLPLTSLPFIFKSPSAFFKRTVYKVLFPFMMYYHAKNLAGIIGGNKEALQILRDLGVKVPMKFIFWGVDLSLFFSKNRDECRKKFGIPHDVKLIGYFGKILKEKGLEKLVKAVSQLDGYGLLLVGNGNYEENIKQLIIDLKMQGRVYFYNGVKLADLVDYYNCLDVFVLPTYTTPNCKEQYGRVLIEAMACKIPVVGSSCGAIPNVLENYPLHLIFDEYSLPDLIEKIKKVPDLKLPENFDTKIFLQRFSIENFVSKNIAFYQEVNN